MDLKSGVPYSLIRYPSIPKCPPLEKEIRCEIAIIGAGISGALIGYAFVQAGGDVVFVDRRRVGQGSTAASTGFLQYELDVDLADLIEKIGEKNALKAYTICLRAIDRLKEIFAEIGRPHLFVPKKSLYLASRRSHWRNLNREFLARQRLPLHVELLDRKALKSRTGIPRPGGILSMAGGEVDAFEVTHALLKFCRSKGAVVFERTEVVQYESRGTEVRLKTLSGGVIRAKKVICATGYEAQEHLARPLAKMKSTFALATGIWPSPPLWLRDTLIWETSRPYLYLRRTSHGRLIIGGEDINDSDPEKRERMLLKKIMRLQKSAGDLVGNQNLEVHCSWSGAFAETKDGLPYIGEVPEFPNGYFGLGYGGNGITFSVIAAEFLRDLYFKKPNTDLHLFRFGR